MDRHIYMLFAILLTTMIEVTTASISLVLQTASSHFEISVFKYKYGIHI